MEENLSALVDGELEGEVLMGWVARIGADHGLLRLWADYHLIGDVLRGTGMRPFQVDRFRTALAAEPTIYAPAAAAVHWSVSLPLRRALSFSAAAVAVALVGWMAWPMVEKGPATGDKATGGQPVAQAVAIPSAHGVEDYLLAHQRFTPSFAMQGAAPYIRLVGDTPGSGK